MTTADRSDHPADPPPRPAGTGAHRVQRQVPVPPAPIPVRLDAAPTLTAPWQTGSTQPLPTTPAAGPPRRTSVRAAAAAASAGTASPAPPAAVTDGGDGGLGTPSVTGPPDSGPSDVAAPPRIPWAPLPDPTVPPTPDLAPGLPTEPPIDPDDRTSTAPVPPTAASTGHPATGRAPAPTRIRRTMRALAGTLVGIALGGLATWVVVFGQSRVLAAQTPAWDWSHDPLGILLVTAGAALLAVVIGLGVWSAATPVAAGAGTLLVGAAYLYVPATSQLTTISWLATEHTAGSVQRVAVTATSGTVLVIGALLLAAGLAMVLLRRRLSQGAHPGR